MRLLQIQANGSFSLVSHEGTSIPPYAILSHTWSENNEDEVSFDDMRNETGKEKRGYAKLRFCAEQATKDGLEHLWVDTCCIDKSSSAELSEAITSMFRWYKNSAQCYVYLADVSTKKRKVDHESPDITWLLAFRISRWFTRGWTLQELLAPRVVLFFARDGELLGDKFSLEQDIHDVTRIPIPALRGAPLHSFSVDDRMSWAATRITKREEDSAYSLLGIFGVSMAPIYGEQKAAALRRLRKEIREVNQDEGSSSDDEKRQALMESLRFDQIDARYATIKNAHAKTCEWLLQKPEHIEWLDPTTLPSHHGFLWIKGKPGTGKSTLMKFAFGHARKVRKGNIVIAFFFHARGEVLEKTIAGMYRSLLLQLLENIPTLQCNPGSLSLIPSNIGADYQWNRHSLEDQLQQAVLSLGETPVTCFIDALDECEQWEVRSMISFFERLGELAVSSGRSFRVCFSSRHYPEVTIRTGISLVLEGQEGHTEDINNYLESALKIGTSESAQNIRKDLQEKSSGVFMWVVLVVDILNQEYDGGRLYTLERRLEQIPAGLHDLFRDILTRDSNDKDELILCIQWVLFAKQPLQPGELYFAILAGIEPNPLASQHYWEVTPDSIRRFLLRSSKGLTEITKSKNKKVQFIHESVRDFLLKENGLSKIWPELEGNFRGQSHERLKQCCHDHISIGVASSFMLPYDSSKPSLKKSTRLRKKTAKTFPFLEYAIRNILYHADTAEGAGISQANFLNSFPLPLWIQYDNLLQRYEVRRHTQGVSLLYLLAELNTANLIRVLGSASRSMDIEAERYGCPVFAALAMNNEQALEACLESIEAQHAHGNPLEVAGGKKVQYKSVQRASRRDFVYIKLNGFLMTAAEFGNDRVLALSITSRKFEIDSQGSKFADVVREASTNDCGMSLRLLSAINSAKVNKTAEKYQLLSKAVEKGHLGVIEALLENGADVNAGNGAANALDQALRHGRKDILELLLDYGADVDAQVVHHGTALQRASNHGDKEIVELLIGKGARVNAQGVGSYGKYVNALQAASFGGHKEIVALLLEQGAAINAPGGIYGTALQAACACRRKDIVELLIDKGADIGKALEGASFNGHEEIVKLLLDKGADIGNALEQASIKGHKEIVELLLERGADVGDALERASLDGRKEIVELLLDKGAADTGNALERASFNGHKGIVALLLERGADFSANYALDLASASGHKEIVELLLDKGAYIGQALKTASRYGQKTIVELLLDKGVDVNSEDEASGGNALTTASKFGHKEIAELLLRRGADVGDALKTASEWGHKEVVALLLENGADDVGNALEKASGSGHKEVVALLQKHSKAGPSK